MTDSDQHPAPEKLLEYIRSITVFSAESWKILQPALEVKEFRKGEILLESGEISTSIFFVHKGYCRAFHLIDGDEINTGFFFENDFATNIKSLRQNTPSEYALMACEAMETVKFDKDRLINAYRESHEIETLGRKLLEQILSKQEEHLSLFKLLNPEQRYSWLEKNQPELLQRVSLTQLASYLGISRESLSRIRSRRARK